VESVVVGEERSVLHIHHLVKVLTINRYKERREIDIKYTKKMGISKYLARQTGRKDKFMK